MSMNRQCSVQSWPVDTLPPEQQARLAEILERYLTEQEKGGAPDTQRIIAEHPDLAEPLAVYFDSLDFLHQAAVGLGRTDGQVRSKSRVSQEPLGDYRIVREIGRGGMGVVYEAQQISLNRRVALKVLPFAAVLDQKQIARFENEARAAAQLRHPHIVPVFSVGCERGVHYYAMQYIEGQPLDMAIAQMRSSTDTQPKNHSSKGKNTRVPGSDAGPSMSTLKNFVTTNSVGSREYSRTICRLAIQAAEALQHAHDYGIVHRDVKPSNLLLDREGKLWIADFGLARFQADAGLTTTGQIIGTLHYMSPEQATGESSLVDHRTDVYSLGITLYEALTLRPAFEGTDRAKLLHRIAEEEPRAPRRINPAIPLDLETIVLKAISKSPVQRYATAGQMADDLKRFLEGKPTLARRPTPAQRIAKWAGRHKNAVLSAVGLLALAMAGLVVATLLITQEHSRTKAALAQSETNLQRAETHYREAREVVDQFGARLAEQLADVPGAEQLRYELLNDTLDYYRGFIEHAGDDPALRSDLAITHFKAATITEQIGDKNKARAAYEDARRMFARLAADRPEVPTYRGDLALCYNNLGLLSSGSGDTAQADSAYRKAIEIQEKLIAEFPDRARFHAELALSHSNLGLLAHETDRIAAADDSYRMAIAIQEKLARTHLQQPKYRSHLAISYNNLSFLHGKADASQAQHFCRRAISILEELAQSHPDTLKYQSDLALAYNNLGALQNHNGQSAEAAASYDLAVAVQRQLVRKAPSVISSRRDLAITYNNLGRLHSETDRSAPAEEALANARAIFEDLIADYPNELTYRSSLGGVLNNQAMALERLERSDEAQSAYRAAIEHQRFALERAESVTRFREFLSKHYWNYGQLLQKLGLLDEACEVAVARKELWADHPERLYRAAVELAAIAGKIQQTGNDPPTHEPAAEERSADSAVAALREAIEAGFDRFDEIQKDPGLDAIREHPGFRELLDVLAERESSEPPT